MSYIVLLSGSLVLFGWIFSIDVLKSILPGLVTMKALTSVCFIFDGISYSLINRKDHQNHDLMIMTASILTFITMSIALTCAIIQVPTPFDFIFNDTGAKSVAPGVPSVATMLLFFITSFVAMFGLTASRSRKVFKCGGYFVMIVSVVALLGYLFSAPAAYFYIAHKSTAMAPLTAVLFLLTGLSMIRVR